MVLCPFIRPPAGVENHWTHDLRMKVAEDLSRPKISRRIPISELYFDPQARLEVVFNAYLQTSHTFLPTPVGGESAA